MAYTNATFYIDYINGSDTTRTTLSSVVFSDGGGDAVIGTKAAHGLVTGAVIAVTGCTKAYANSSWKITRTDADTFTLDGASWASFTGVDVTGDAVPFGGSSWTDAWATIQGGATAVHIAPGDTIKVAKSPKPVKLGTATWTTCPDTLPTAKNITSSTNATPVSVTCTTHGFSNGDIIYIQNHTTNLTANGTWRITYVDANTFTLDGSVAGGIGANGTATKCPNQVVALSSALTTVKHVTRCEVAWTPSGSSTSNINTTVYKEGDGSAFVSKSSPSNSTLYAYYPVSGDFSSFNCLSLWIRVATTIDSTARWSLWLCTSADGTNPVDEFKLPVLPVANMWSPVTITKEGGGTLSGSVASIALYSGTSAATTAGIYMDNIMATQTSGFNLTSLISTNTSEQGGTDAWYPIQSISEDLKLIRLDCDYYLTAAANLTTRGGGWHGTTNSYTTYYRETIKTAMFDSGTHGSNTQTIMDSGTSAAAITFSGGWNTVSGEKDGETFFDGQNCCGSGVYGNSKSYLSVERISTVRYYSGIYGLGCTFCTWESILSVTGCTYGISLSLGSDMTIKASYANNNYYGLVCNIPRASITLNSANNNYYAGIIGQTSSQICIFESLKYVCNNPTYGIYLQAAFAVIKSNTAVTHNGGHGVYLSNADWSKLALGTIGWNGGYGIYLNAYAPCYIYGGTTSNNASGGVYASWGKIYAHNFTINEGTEVVLVAAGGTDTGRNCGYYGSYHNGSSIIHKSIIEGGTILYQKTVYHTPSVGAWKLSPTNAVRTVLYPLSICLARVYCQANKTVTVKVWACRDNVGINAVLACRASQLTGIGVLDITDPMTVAAGTWDASQDNGEELMINFKPTIAGVVEIEGWAYGGTAYSAYFSDMEITQED